MTEGWFGKFIDGFSVVVSFAGIATSLGLGVSLICGSMNHLFGIPQTNNVMLTIIILVTMVFIISAISAAYKGIKILSNINTFLAWTLLFATICMRPHINILNNIVRSVGCISRTWRETFS